MLTCLPRDNSGTKEETGGGAFGERGHRNHFLTVVDRMAA